MTTAAAGNAASTSGTPAGASAAQGAVTTPAGAANAPAASQGTQGASITGQVTTQPVAGAQESITGQSNEPGTTKKPDGEAGAQETVELKVTFPDGTDAKVQESYLAVAKKHGFKGEAAQEVVNLFADVVKSRDAAFEKQMTSAKEKILNDMLEESKKDTEIGGAKFEENLALANKAAHRFGGKEFVEALVKSGLGRHKAVIRALANAGRAISEDNISGTTGATRAGVTPQQTLEAAFPKSPEMFQKK